MFERVQKEIGDTKHELPGINAEIVWSSTFQMTHAAHRCRHVLHAVDKRVPEIHCLQMSEEEWAKASKLCAFLETSASIIEHQSGTQYTTLSLRLMA